MSDFDFNVELNAPKMKEGAYTVTIKSVDDSKNRSEYNGSAYLDFNLKAEDGSEGRARFWKVKPTDKPESAEFKSRVLKQFLINAGITDFTNPIEVIKSSVGKSLNVLMRSSEYWTTNRETDEPSIRKRIEYYTSRNVGETLTYKDSINKPLSGDEMNAYMAAHKAWSGTEKTPAETNGNYPF